MVGKCAVTAKPEFGVTVSSAIAKRCSLKRRRSGRFPDGLVPMVGYSG